MKKNLKAMFLTALICMLMLIFPNSVRADEKNIIDFPENTWMDLKFDEPGNRYGTEHGYYYKVTVPTDSIVTLYGNVTYLAFYSFDSHFRKTQYSFSGSLKDDGEQFALVKGTYYFVTEGQLKYSLTPVIQTTNYCLPKAKSLKANKKITVVQTSAENYSRWYKIKLTKNKKISFSSNKLVYLFSKNGGMIETTRSGSKIMTYRTQKKLKKGTYYLMITRDDFVAGIGTRASITSLVWK